MEEQIIVNKTERPNSYEAGKAGARWKIYFNLYWFFIISPCIYSGIFILKFGK